MSKARNITKRSLAVLLAFLMLLFIMAETIQPPAQAIAVTATTVALITAMMIAGGLIFTSESQAQQLAEHVYMQISDIDWDEVLAVTSGQVIGEFPPGTMVVELASTKFKELLNTISNLLSPAIIDDGLGDALDMLVIGLTGTSIIFEDGTSLSVHDSSFANRLTGFIERSTPIHNLNIGGVSVEWEVVHSYNANGRPLTDITAVASNGRSGNTLFIRRDVTYNYTGAESGRMVFVFTQHDGRLRLRYGGFQHVTPAHTDLVLDWVTLPPMSNIVDIGLPPWQRFTHWDEFMQDGWNIDLQPKLDLIENIMTGTGNVELLIPPITGTGTTGVMTPEGQPRRWEDSVASPGTWTIPRPPIVSDEERLEELFGDEILHVVDLGNGEYMVYLLNGDVVRVKLHADGTYEYIRYTPPTPEPSPTPSPTPTPTPSPLPETVTGLPDWIRRLIPPQISPPVVPSLPAMPNPVPTPDPQPSPYPDPQPQPTPTPTPTPITVLPPMPDPDTTPDPEASPTPSPRPVPPFHPDPRPQPQQSPYPEPSPQPSPAPDPGDGQEPIPPVDPGTPPQPPQPPQRIFAMFPFCIPWDVYNFVVGMSASPVVPYWEFVPFPFLAAIGVDVEWRIDFEMFNTPVLIFRYLMLALAIWGLFSSTKRFLWTGGG